jgi:hypothetical protein
MRSNKVIHCTTCLRISFNHFSSIVSSLDSCTTSSARMIRFSMEIFSLTFLVFLYPHAGKWDAKILNRLSRGRKASMIVASHNQPSRTASLKPSSLSQKSLNLKRLFGHSIVLIIRCNRAAWLETGEDRAGSKFSGFLAPSLLARMLRLF